MHLKIIHADSYSEMEEKYNKFTIELESQNYKLVVKDIKVHEYYNAQYDRGYMTYHIFYHVE